ncbi:High mobility group box domain [Macleaya cordata]|uniref:High mobility group box domain n=1 Tax=Macleaya cordata TaxID=56857 RepID=A0A200QJV9_MACCD|nr:High mobility group box domain [Macleaya cordata]
MAAGASAKSNPPRTRKRVDAEANSLKRAKNGSAFTRCEECKKDVPVVLIDMHDCSLDSKIKMSLEAQVVEVVTEKKKTVSSEPKPRKSKKEKKAKDPNMPKRPTTAFFLFMEDFRKSFKEANPDNKSVSVVAKEGGEKWKSMSDEEKKPFMDRFQELKAEYEKAMENFNAENAEEDQEVQEGQDEQEQGTSDKEE